MITKLEVLLDEYLGKKAPQLPTNVKEVIVKFAPWITLLMLLLSLPAILALFGLGAFLMPVSYVAGVGFGLTYTLSLIILAVSLVLEAIAIPGLMKRSKKGWNLVFYATLVGIVSNVLSINIMSIILGALVPLYFLFQVRSYYK